MKILSDFDGVWTDQAAEAAAVKAFFAQETAGLAGVEVGEVERDFGRYLEEIRRSPGEYGWAPEGRITAYVDEDPLLETGALAMYLEGGRAEPRASAYREAVLAAGHADVTAFANRCFLASMQKFRREHVALLVAGSRETLQALRTAGAEVVVVSNSPPEKIHAWFEHAGVACEGPGALLRVRGNAGKWVLGGDQRVEVGGRSICVDRPKYRALLEEEQPELVIGDVYSLDLALPASMRRMGARGAPRTLVLRRHGHTPDWVARDRAEGEIDRLVSGVHELVGLARPGACV